MVILQQTKYYNLWKEKKVGNWEIFKDEFNVFLRHTKQDFIWMSTLDWEKRRHDVFEKQARGKVLIAGLGLGYDVLIIKNKPNIISIDVIEIDKEIIDLVSSVVKDQKVKIIHDRILHYMQTTNKKYDTIYFDIFPHDVVNYPEQVQILINQARKMLNTNGKILFWKLYEDPIL